MVLVVIAGDGREVAGVVQVAGSGRLPIAWGAMGDHIFLDLRDGEQPGRVMVQRLNSDVPRPGGPIVSLVAGRLC